MNLFKYYTRRSLTIMLIIDTILIVSMLFFYAGPEHIFHWFRIGISAKTSWDWMQLLIVPVFLALGGVLYSSFQSGTNKKEALDKQREEALQVYFTVISELLLDKDLENNEKAQAVAQARTITTLRILDPVRRATLLRFLSGAKLTEPKMGITAYFTGLDFHGTDLHGLNFIGADFSNCNLSHTNLSNCNLTQATLSNANLQHADLLSSNLQNTSCIFARFTKANVSFADFNGAFLSMASFKKALLLNVNLNNAILKETNFKGAKVVTVEMNNETNLSNIKWLTKQELEAQKIKSIITSNKDTNSKVSTPPSMPTSDKLPLQSTQENSH